MSVGQIDSTPRMVDNWRAYVHFNLSVNARMKAQKVVEVFKLKFTIKSGPQNSNIDSLI